MSVLNQSGEEPIDCPLCMEPLEVDDLNFFPCTCGYQICRFCWHRIRLDENGGLCPACRKAYSENPADFIPLSQEQVAKLKAEKRQRDQQRKAKLTESRKHLASVRVVQRNLVFVVGLPVRLADPEVLKRHEYFGKFGKIHKVVINQSTSYAGSQGPSASAYVTYMKSDDALRAIQAVNNITIDNRLIKSSLGTTKYCSHFMKNQPCPKSDCMYLHEYGDPEASFTKEQMHAGKHQEYEKKLHEDLLARAKQQQINNNNNTNTTNTTGPSETKAPPTSNGSVNQKPATRGGEQQGGGATNGNAPKEGGNKENWPTLNIEKDGKKDSKDKGKKGKTKGGVDGVGKRIEHNNSTSSHSNSVKKDTNVFSNGKINEIRLQDRIYKTEVKDGWKSDSSQSTLLSSEPTPSPSPPEPHLVPSAPLLSTTTVSGSKLQPVVNLVDDNTSFFSINTFQKIGTAGEHRDQDDHEGADVHPEDGHSSAALLTDTLPNINTSEDWAAAFGFTSRQHQQQQQLQLQQQHHVGGGGEQEKRKSAIEAFGGRGLGAFGGHDAGFGKDIDNYNGFFEMSKLQENIMDVLSAAKSSNGYSFKQEAPAHGVPSAAPSGVPSQTHPPNGLEHNMSKFFNDFHKFNSKMEPTAAPPVYPNGFNGLHYQGIQNHLLLQQKQLEEQLMNLSLKSQAGGGTFDVGGGYLNRAASVTSPSTPYMNGDAPLLHHAHHHNHQQMTAPHMGLYGNSQTKHQNMAVRNSSEAELDFDPFQETQKAFAELMANEHSHKAHQPNRGGPINGIVHSQSGGHLPPPPPGFLQQQNTTPHMNSFGSKILPFLNMSNSQQQINNSTQNSWPSSFNAQLAQQPPQQKSLSNTTCNDWKVLDPAILSSSRHYQLAQMPAPYSNLGSQQIQQQNGVGGGPSPFDYPAPTNTTFTNYTTQQQQQQAPLPPQQQPQTQNLQNIQPNYANFTTNWFNTELNSQISSPPGFRSNQTTKQQEC